MIIIYFGIILFELIERIKFIETREITQPVVSNGISYDRLRQRHPG